MSEKLFLVDLNLGGNQLKNAVVSQLDTAPESPKAGQIYFDTTENKFKYFDGTKWQAVQQYTIDEFSINREAFAKGQIKVNNALDDDEKALLEGQLFDTKFTAVIVANPSNINYEGKQVTVTYTLTTKYGAGAVDLDSAPIDWTRTAVGTYTKTAIVDTTTGSSISSGAVTCSYRSRSKNSNSAGVSIYKPSYVFYSDKESLVADDLTNLATTGTLLSSNNNVKGNGKSIQAKTAGQYAYFCISNTSSISDVQQLGVSILQNKTGVALDRVNYGSYKVYRTANALGAQALSINII